MDQRCVDQVLNLHVHHFIQRDRHKFQQKNAQPHITIVSLEHLQQQQIEKLSLTDLNTIKHLWVNWNAARGADIKHRETLGCST